MDGSWLTTTWTYHQEDTYRAKIYGPLPVLFSSSKWASPPWDRATWVSSRVYLRPSGAEREFNITHFSSGTIKQHCINILLLRTRTHKPRRWQHREVRLRLRFQALVRIQMHCQPVMFLWNSVSLVQQTKPVQQKTSCMMQSAPVRVCHSIEYFQPTQLGQELLSFS